MLKLIKIGISGAGGYGYWYIKEAIAKKTEWQIEIAAVYDPEIMNLPICSELKELSIPFFSKYSDFVEALDSIDLAVIVSPIHFHAIQTIDALKKGCNVLLDKPLAGNIAQAEQILKTAKDTEKWVMVGYQWSFSKAIRSLKEDLIAGKFGKVQRAKTLVFWPRGYDYYARNNWTGKQVNEDGLVINDSPINNAMAHFLHNLLFLTGDTMESSAVPLKGKAELYRAYPVETFDTVVIDLKTTSQIRIQAYLSHVTKNEKGPLFILECEKAVIYYGELSNEITVVQMDGLTKVYGDPEDTEQFHKLFVAVDTCRAEKEPICTAETAFQHTRLIDALSTLDKAVLFDENRIQDLAGERKYVDGLGYMLFSSYQQGVLPSKKGFAIKGKIQRFKL